MNRTEHIITLDIHKTVANASVCLKKGDTAHRFLINLSEAGCPYLIAEDCVAVFSAVKPDGEALFNQCSIEENVIVYDVTEQTTAVSGVFPCEIQIYGADASLLTSASFLLIVELPEINAASVCSSSEYSALSEMIAQTLSTKTSIETALENGEFVGLSAYEVACENGFEGTEKEWLASLAGGSGEADVSAEYAAAVEAGTVSSVREYLWSLEAGRYYLYDESNLTRYHLHAMAGEAADGSVIARTLTVVNEFCNVEFYGGNNTTDYSAVPDVLIEGETGDIYCRGVLLGSGSGIYIGDGDLPEGYDVQIIPDGDAQEAATVAYVDGLVGDIEAALEALL